MEAANEAARRATNAILEREGSAAPHAALWPLEEPEFFEPMRAYDLLRFQLGLPHAGIQPDLRLLRTSDHAKAAN